MPIARIVLFVLSLTKRINKNYNTSIVKFMYSKILSAQKCEILSSVYTHINTTDKEI